MPTSDPEVHRELRPGDPIAGECPICGPLVLRALPFRYRFHERYLYGVTCPRCALAFLSPMPSDEEIRGLYSEEYFTECTNECGAHGRMAYMDLVESAAEDRHRAATRLDRSLFAHLGRRGVFCEIGCGPGHFLAEMRAAGWEVKGLELSEFAVRHARERLGLHVDAGALEPGALSDGSIDAAFLGDVLEHLPRPLTALRTLRAALKEDGIVAIAVPSTLNLLSGRVGLDLYRALGRMKTLRIPPYHLFEYTPSTLRRMIAAAGFDVLELRQSAVPLRRMGLRGNRLENAGKASLQVLARATSAVLNRGGDRLLAIARRRQ